VVVYLCAYGATTHPPLTASRHSWMFHVDFRFGARPGITMINIAGTASAAPMSFI
jgi:hypothetical protein